MTALSRLSEALGEITEVRVAGGHVSEAQGDTINVVNVIAAGERAMHVTASETKEIQIRTWRYTPHGLMYELESEENGVKQMVPAHAVHPLRGDFAGSDHGRGSSSRSLAGAMVQPCRSVAGLCHYCKRRPWQFQAGSAVHHHVAATGVSWRRQTQPGLPAAENQRAGRGRQ